MSSYFHSASQSCSINFLQIARFDIFYVWFVYFAVIARVWINLHGQHVLYSDVVKRDPTATWLRLTARKRNGTGVYSEIFVSWILHFFLFNLLIFIFLLILLFFYTFFYTHNIYPRTFLFHNIDTLQFFLFIYFLSFFYAFFNHDIYPHPRPTSPTHYARPTTRVEQKVPVSSPTQYLIFFSFLFFSVFCVVVFYKYIPK